MRIKQFPRRRLALLLAVLALLTLCACGGADDAPDGTETENGQEAAPPRDMDDGGTASEPADAAEPAEDEFVPTGNVNPLTGLCDGITDAALTRKPVAIMVSNSYNSLPQWGISQADIIYEMLAEGRITRFMAIFKDPSRIDKLASIRSARPYFIDIAQSYGAVYMHFGGSVPAYDAIAARKDLIALDGIRGGWEGTLYNRDPQRRKEIGYEHSVFVTGQSVEAALSSLKQDLTQAEQPSAFRFASTPSSAAGTAANKVTLTFSERHKPWFAYDAEKGTYLRWQYGDPHMDAWLDCQIEVKNLLVLRMETTDVPGSELKLVEIDTTGTGEGYYFCEGKYIPITWEKAAYNAPIAYYDAAGAPLELARGKTFVSVVTRGAEVVIE